MVTESDEEGETLEEKTLEKKTLKKKEKENNDEIKYCFSMGDSYHIITYDPIISVDNINVKIYHKPHANSNSETSEFFYYEFFFCTEFSENQFRHTKTVIKNSKLRTHQQWNTLDRIISGVLSLKHWSSLNFWRLSFIILPIFASENKDLSSLNQRLESFKNLKAWLENYGNSSSSTIVSSQKSINLKIINPSSSTSGGTGRSFFNPSTSQISLLKSNLNFQQILVFLEENVHMDNKWFGLKLIKNCFSGNFFFFFPFYFTFFF